MHSKQKGNIAFSSVVLILQKNGFNVFSEIGDYSKIDLIAEMNSVTKTIQVKFLGQSKNSLTLELEKKGPNGYRYTYSKKDVDWFALYSPYTEQIAFVKSSEACSNKTTFSIHLGKTLNNQSKSVRSIEDYDINEFLRDFTQGTVSPINGEDKVQTTTS